MAIIKKFNSNYIYISNRLNSRLKTILESPLTIVEAPTGYGKTTVVKEYFANNNIRNIWFNIDTNDKDQFFSDFCKRITSVNEVCAKMLSSVGFPKDSDAASVIAKILFDMEFREDTILILDNYHLICDEYFNQIIKDLSFGKNAKLHVVFLTQAITSGVTFDLILKKKLNYLNKADFELSESEIDEYYKNSGVKLSKEESDFLYQYTEGWPSALYLQMLSYVSTNKFEPTVSVDNLVCNAIWDNINRKEQDCLISLSIFSNFSFRQAIAMNEGDISEKEIENLLDNNAFIKYDSKSRKYYIHSILKYFLEREFDKLEPLFKKQIYKNAGKWFVANEEYFEAIKYYNKIGDYEDILSLDYKASTLIKEMNSNNEALFVGITKNIKNQWKIKYINTYLIFVYSLILYNERDVFDKECNLLFELIEESDLSKREKDNYYGECILLKSFGCYNDLEKLAEYYEKAYALLKAPSVIFDGNSSFTFFNPSVFAAMHTTVGEANKELRLIDKIMPMYYKLFNGASKGAEALYRAESLMNSGEFLDAATLCKKAKYMSETRKQTDVYISALFMLSRIAYYNADYDTINENSGLIRRKLENTNRTDLTYMADMCEGYIRVALDSPELVPSWLTNNISIENNCRIHTLGFANVIYGKYLLSKEKYDDFLAISGQMLGVASVFNNVMYKIYTYIYIAIANYAVQREGKAGDILVEAVKLAQPDDILLPFVENYGVIVNLFTGEKLSPYKEFVNKIRTLTRKYSRGLRSSKKASLNDQSLGLTNREYEVAKLAAQRLSNREIADSLFIAESTVKSNLKVVFNKLGINSRNELKNFFD